MEVRELIHAIGDECVNDSPDNGGDNNNFGNPDADGDGQGGFGDNGDNGGGGFGDNGGGSPDDGQPMAQVLQMSSGREGTQFKSDTQVDAQQIVAKLMITEGPRAGEEIPVQSYEISLGRSKKADIYLDDEKLSRIHAKIARVGMGYRLIDLNSRHGTYVNGMRVLEHPLTSFDEIQIGKTKIKFLISNLMSSDMGGG